MSLAGDWRQRHPSPGGRGRLFFYLFLLAFVILVIIKADTFVSGFTRIFFPADSAGQVGETGGE